MLVLNRLWESHTHTTVIAHVHHSHGQDLTDSQTITLTIC